MAIYRTLYYGRMRVGTGGRMTIPRDIRLKCGIEEGDTLTVRVEGTPQGDHTQMVVWRDEPEHDE